MCLPFKDDLPPEIQQHGFVPCLQCRELKRLVSNKRIQRLTGRAEGRGSPNQTLRTRCDMRCSLPEATPWNKSSTKQNPRVLLQACHRPLQDVPSSKDTIILWPSRLGLSVPLFVMLINSEFECRETLESRSTIVSVALTFNYPKIFWETRQEVATVSQSWSIISWSTLRNAAREAGEMLADHKHNRPLSQLPIRKATPKQASQKKKKNKTFLFQFLFQPEMRLSKY